MSERSLAERRRRSASSAFFRAAGLAVAALAWACAAPVLAQGAPAAAAAPATAAASAPLPAAAEALRQRAAAEQPLLLDTLRALVGIESGSRDLEGLARAADLVAERLRAAGLQTQLLPARAADFHPQLAGAPVGAMVYATRQGRGQRKVLLIAHMDTVYPRGMGAKQPFRIDGDRAYGLGIADDKGGVALVLHTVALLQRLGFDDYAQLGVLINGDEEIGSPGSAARLAELGSEYDAVFSFEGGGFDHDMVRLATSSIATVELKVTGRASHAGANPDGGRNALVELAHQVLQTRNLGDPARGLRLNWTVAQAGETRNVIPASASAVADVRALANEDLDLLEAQLREAVQRHLVPDTQVELRFNRGRPAFRANQASVRLARHARSVFGELGLALDVRDRATGGGTDAAYAGLRPRGGVLEGFGLRGWGAHSNDDEYIFISSIVPRLYLSARMVMDVGSGRVAW